MNYPFWKYKFDFVLALFLLIVLFPMLVILYVLSSWNVKSNGIFSQKRVGQGGRLFTIYKFTTIAPKTHQISYFGKCLRKFKLDELPQIINILKGEMSFVGPRPDVQGYYDRLEGEDRKVLQLRPGLTSWASIKYSDEEYVLQFQDNPQKFNDTVLFPDKVKMNLEYLEKMSLKEDFKIVLHTLKNCYKK